MEQTDVIRNLETDLLKRNREIEQTNQHMSILEIEIEELKGKISEQENKGSTSIYHEQ